MSSGTARTHGAVTGFTLHALEHRPSRHRFLGVEPEVVIVAVDIRTSVARRDLGVAVGHFGVEARRMTLQAVEVTLIGVQVGVRLTVTRYQIVLDGARVAVKAGIAEAALVGVLAETQPGRSRRPLRPRRPGRTLVAFAAQRNESAKQRRQDSEAISISHSYPPPLIG